MTVTRNALLLVSSSLLAACAGSASSTSSLTNSEELNERALGLTDVTVVSPLDERVLLRADTPLANGRRLLAGNLAEQIGQLVEHFSPVESLERLRVVCTRFDPRASGQGAQIRFVLQPVVSEGESGVLTTQDAAVHIFYDLSTDLTRELARRLVSLPGARAQQPLDGPHARIADEVANGREGMPGSYTTQLRDIVREYGARGTVSRVTFMRNVDVKGNTWVFGGVDVSPTGATIPLSIPRAGNAGEQRVVLNGSFPFGVSFSPSPTSSSTTLGLLLDPIRLGILHDTNPEGAKQRVVAAYGAALALENPDEHDATSADCGSCHLAGTARRVAEHVAASHRYGGELPIEHLFREEATGGAGGLLRARERRPLPPDQLRACGYAGREVVIAQRTINESAVAAQRMGDLGQ